MGGRLGRAAPHPRTGIDPRTGRAHPRLSVGEFLTGALPSVPDVVDWLSAVPDWPMYGNDEWGDCVWAEIGHAIESTTAYGQGTPVLVTDEDVLKGYSDVTGFDPNAGPPGSNPTDQGTVMQDALDYWRKTGVGGHTIVAFAEVNVADLDEVAECIYLFDGVHIGFDFPNSAMQQFDAGQPWDVVDDDGGNDGGHAVFGGLRRQQVLAVVRDGAGVIVGFEVLTWGKRQLMTAAFWRKYVREAWVTVDRAWVNAAGQTPVPGVDLVAWGEAFATITGQPDPFPAPDPGPTPVPPGPTPAPTPDPGPAPDPTPPTDVDVTFAAALHTWLARERWELNHRDRKLRHAARIWLDARNL
jgi:hypothetical protein